MLSRFIRPNYKDRFTISFLDQSGNMIKLRVYRRRWLAMNAWAGVIIINGRVTLEIQSPDPDMIMHCLVREAWNRDPTAQEPRAAVIAE